MKIKAKVIFYVSWIKPAKCIYVYIDKIVLARMQREGHLHLLLAELYNTTSLENNLKICQNLLKIQII